MNTSDQNSKASGDPGGLAPHRWLILLAMTGSLAMIMLDTTVVAVALPTIQKTLGVDQNVLEWIIIAYLVILASFMALGGKLGDLFGRPRAFLIGTVGFGLSSLMCGFAWSGESLVGFRILQGFFAVIMQPASSAIVINSFATGERGKAMAVYAGIPLLFLTAGPVVGGLITEYGSWRYCFLLNVPISVVVATMAVLLKPKDPKQTGKRRFDWIGTVLLGIGMPCFIVAIQQASEWGWDSSLTLGLGGLGIVMLGAFTIVEFRVQDPIVSLGLFRQKVFLGDSILLFVTQASLTGVSIFVVIHLQVVMNFSPEEAGLAMLPMLLPAAVMIYLAGRSYDRMGGRIPVIGGGVLICTGLGLLAVGMGQKSYLIMGIGMGLVGLGVPFVQLPANTDGMSRVHATRRGMASGVLQTFRQVGSVIGLAAIGAVIAATQSAQLNSDPEIAAHADLAKSSLVDRAARGNANALDKLRSEDPEVADSLAKVVSDGIETGMWTAAGFSSMIIFIGIFLLEGRPANDPEE
ncbi:MAG: hypothetical protein CBC35_00155 [Planctomycetes bacterium TMED75]|nr:hypothetical protein [Planctomycetaceae bacterium]OUU96943.1 MAG: hypothetical protein CBC35_00155 [Planctomycetes bacterium TMED75]